MGYLLGNIGLLYFYLKQYNIAEISLKKSLEFEPNQQNILLLLGNTLYV